MSGITFAGNTGNVGSVIDRLCESCIRIKDKPAEEIKLSELVTCLEAMQAMQITNLTINDIHDILDVMELEKIN